MVVESSLVLPLASGKGHHPTLPVSRSTPRACWPTNLAQLVTLGLVNDPVSKNQRKP